jgi:hypothetical protein
MCNTVIRIYFNIHFYVTGLEQHGLQLTLDVTQSIVMGYAISGEQ